MLQLELAVQMHPEQGTSTLTAIQGCFSNGSRAGRSGSALALKACAAQLSGEQVTSILDFLLGQGLADADDEVRSQMVAAGELPHSPRCDMSPVRSAGPALSYGQAQQGQPCSRLAMYVCLPERRFLAGMELVVKHGAEHTSNMLSVFEGYLEAKGVKDESSYDRVREGVVIFLGTLAQHLDAEGPKVISSYSAFTFSSPS